ncbi:hypothetical protein CPB83DRAFT_162061 [Crepidotus variabilis]|uniref:Nephrocystin 3-like N-terminal domain-containing protein n=1 Tax=Crepidotus variabilis TaxID=179855 RepID=A0A9P6EKJ1_9AGAR|nr:hypothetical protein CPB83DRAFT_162061 [Crepidotus variabilis]
MLSPRDDEGPSSVVLFNNAENVQLQDTHIAVTIGNNNTNQNIVINPKSKWDPIELLLHYCALDGLVDSKERYDPPKCAPETREAILRDIIAWAKGGVSTPTFLWLYGSAGAGKSAICQTIAETFRREETLLANFFFSRGAGASGRSNGDRLIPTLIYQLQLNLPETRSFIKKAIRKDRSILTSTRATQMESLFCSALDQFSIRRWFRDLSGKQSRLIILDGWDECQDKEVQCDLLRIIADTTASMSMPLRFIIASRPEAHIRHTFDIHPSLNNGTVRRINLDEDQDARVAIFKFVRTKFRNILETHPLRQHLDPSWPSDQVVELLVAKSSPQFIFASTAMNYISFANDRPDVRLNAIITMAENPPEDPDEAPLENIDRLYRFIFSGVNSKHRSNVWTILGIIHLASRKGFTVPTPSPLFFEELLGVPPGTVDIMLIPLLSVISLPLTREAAIKSLHASLFDFLLDSHRSRDMAINLALAHLRLLEYYGHRVLKSFKPNFYKGVLQHDVFLGDLEAKCRPSIEHITTSALIALEYTSIELVDLPSFDIKLPPPEIPDRHPTLQAVELIELVFSCLVKHGTEQMRIPGLFNNSSRIRFCRSFAFRME